MKQISWRMIQVLMVVSHFAMAQPGLYLQSDNGKKEYHFTEGQVVEFYYDKPIDCEQCKNCNFYLVKGEYLGLKDDKVLLAPLHTENSSVKDGWGKFEQVGYNYYDDHREQFTYSLNGVTSVRVYSKAKENRRDWGGVLIGLSLINNLIIAPLVAYDFGNNTMNGKEYINMSIPGWIGLAGGITMASIPIKKEYKLKANGRKTWKLLKN